MSYVNGEKNIGRPKKKINILIEENTNFSNKRIINVVVKILNNNTYYVDNTSHVYDVNTHLNIGKLINNKIYYYDRELKLEEYI